MDFMGPIPTAAGAGEDVKPGSVLNRLASVERVVDELDARMEQLVHRLLPMITQQPRTDPENVKHPMPPAALSPLTERLEALHAHLWKVTSGMVELLERLQL